MLLGWRGVWVNVSVLKEGKPNARTPLGIFFAGNGARAHMAVSSLGLSITPPLVCYSCHIFLSGIQYFINPSRVIKVFWCWVLDDVHRATAMDVTPTGRPRRPSQPSCGSPRPPEVPKKRRAPRRRRQERTPPQNRQEMSPRGQEQVSAGLYTKPSRGRRARRRFDTQ